MNERIRRFYVNGIDFHKTNRLNFFYMHIKIYNPFMALSFTFGNSFYGFF